MQWLTLVREAALLTVAQVWPCGSQIAVIKLNWYNSEFLQDVLLKVKHLDGVVQYRNVSQVVFKPK